MAAAGNFRPGASKDRDYSDLTELLAKIDGPITRPESLERPTPASAGGAAKSTPVTQKSPSDAPKSVRADPTKTPAAPTNAMKAASASKLGRLDDVSGLLSKGIRPPGTQVSTPPTRVKDWTLLAFMALVVGLLTGTAFTFALPELLGNARIELAHVNPDVQKMAPLKTRIVLGLQKPSAWPAKWQTPANGAKEPSVLSPINSISVNLSVLASLPEHIAQPNRDEKLGLDEFIPLDLRGGILADKSNSAFDARLDALTTGAIGTALGGPIQGDAKLLSDTRPAWQRFAALHTPSNRPKIAIVLDDLGLNVERTQRTIDLPKEINLSFLPYGARSAKLAREARTAGHEILVHVPMEPHGQHDPGDDALMTGMSAQEVSQALARNLAQLDGYVGINNHMGSRFTEDVRALLPVMKSLNERGLIFLDSRTSQASTAAKVGQAAGVPTLGRDVFLDHAQGPDNLLNQLDQLETIARRNGNAIAIGHPHDMTLEVLEVWVRGLEAKGIDLVPLTALLAPART